MQREAVQQLLRDFQSQLETTQGDVLSAPTTQRLLTFIGVFLIAALADNGECRKSRPYAPLRPILDDNGFRWCCTHTPEHCG